MRLFNGNFTETNLNYYKDRMEIPYGENDIAIGLIALIMDIYNMDFGSFDSFSYQELKDAVYHDIGRLEGNQIECILNYYDLKDHRDYKKELMWCSQASYRYQISAALYRLYHCDNTVSFTRQLLFGRSLLLEEIESLNKQIKSLKSELEVKNKKIEHLVDLKSDDDDESIYNMNFSVRTFNCLNRAGIANLSDLAGMKYQDFIRVRNLGKKGIDEITEKLKEYGIIVERA